MITDRRGRILYVNPAWVATYGYSYEEALAGTPSILQSGAQPPEFYAEMWRQLEDPRLGRWRGELVNRAKDGHEVPVLLTITPFSQGGQAAGYMGIALDLSYRRELEEQIARQDRLAAVGLLASGIAHEIGTPLGVMRGRAEFLAMRARDGGVREELGVITEQVDRIAKLVHSLLRIGRPPLEPRLEPVAIAPVVSEVLSLVGQNLRSLSADVLIDVPESLSARADADRLRQVLLDLILNSTQAIHEAIRSGRAQGHQLRIRARNGRDGRVAIAVEDTGCGVADADLPKLFRPFYTTKDIGQGPGLGLAIVAQLCREMDAEVSVASVPGRGATFVVALRAA